MTQSEPPKVFISHASEDKERFVLEFATKLRENGIDAWVDQWEMLPGDSLIDKIFEEGIKQANAIIIILSNFSVQKSWVREELNASMVNRINKKAKIIPVIIDECEVPVSLQSTLYERIEDPKSYDSSFRRILSAIYGSSEKPQIGSPPRHVSLQIDNMPGLSNTDTKIFKVACEVTLNDNTSHVNLQRFSKEIKTLEISDEELHDAIRILEDRMLIEASWSLGDIIPFFKITTHGFENYAKFFMVDFDETVNQALLAVLNHGLETEGAIARHINKPPILVEYVLDILAARKLIKVLKFMGDSQESVIVQEVTAQGRRFAERLR